MDISYDRKLPRSISRVCDATRSLANRVLSEETVDTCSVWLVFFFLELLDLKANVFTFGCLDGCQKLSFSDNSLSPTNEWLDASPIFWRSQRIIA